MIRCIFPIWGVSLDNDVFILALVKVCMLDVTWSNLGVSRFSFRLYLSLLSSSSVWLSVCVCADVFHPALLTNAPLLFSSAFNNGVKGPRGPKGSPGDVGPQGPMGPAGQVKVLNVPNAVEDTLGRKRRQAPDPNQGNKFTHLLLNPTNFLPLFWSIYFICTVITLPELNKALFERIDKLWNEAQRLLKPSGNSQEYPAHSCKDIKLNNKFARNDTCVETVFKIINSSNDILHSANACVSHMECCKLSH